MIIKFLLRRRGGSRAGSRTESARGFDSSLVFHSGSVLRIIRYSLFSILLASCAVLEPAGEHPTPEKIEGAGKPNVGVYVGLVPAVGFTFSRIFIGVGWVPDPDPVGDATEEFK